MTTGKRCSECGTICGSRKEPPVCASCARRARAEEQVKENKRRKRYAREHPIEEYVHKLRTKGTSNDKIAGQLNEHYPPPPPPFGAAAASRYGGQRWTALDVILAAQPRSWPTEWRPQADVDERCRRMETLCREGETHASLRHANFCDKHGGLHGEDPPNEELEEAEAA